MRCGAEAARVTAEQLGELGGATEGIGDELVGGERESRVNSHVPLGDQMRSRRKRPGVELGEPLERALVGWDPEAHSNRTLPGGVPMAIGFQMMAIGFQMPVSIPMRHESEYGPG